MSERRRLRAGVQRDDDGQVPRRLRRFVRRDWPDAPDMFEARRWWRQARREWATAHGFAVDAPFGTRPVADWWAFLKLCEEDR